MFSRQEKFVLFSLATIQFTHIVDFMIMMPLGPQLMRTFAMSSTQFAFLLSSYTFSAGIVGFIGAFFLDRYNRRTSLIVFNLGFAICTLLCSLVPNYQMLLFMRSLTGCFGGLLSAMVLTAVGDAVSAERRGTAMGIVMTAFSLAAVMGVPLSLSLAHTFTWQAPFVGLGAASLLVTLLLYLRFPDMKGHILAKPLGVWASIQNVFSLLTVSHTRNTLLFTFLLVFGQFCTITFLSPSLVFNSGLDEKHLFLVYFFGGLCTIFSSPMAGRLVDRFGAYRVATIGVPLSTIPIFLVTHLSVVHEVWIFLATSLFFLSSSGRMVPAQALAASAVAPHRRGSFMSLNSCGMQIAAGLAAVVAGLVTVKDQHSNYLHHYDWVGYISIAASFAGVAILIWREKRFIEATNGSIPDSGLQTESR